MFKLLKQSRLSRARFGHLNTNHGVINTPFFMPVATRGAVKHVSSEDLKKLGIEIILSNTYHLLLKPGNKYIKRLGGLHKFAGWPKSILTDSGGYQIFSLAGNKNKSGKSLVKINQNGVEFKSYIDGKKFDLTPEKILQIQMDLGVDIAVCLDECVALPASDEYLEKSIELTTTWAKRSKAYLKKTRGRKPLLFAVIQGGLNIDLRQKSLSDLKSIGFDGYNIGGLSVGESSEEMYRVIDGLVPHLPENKPRYLMGVGYPDNIIEAVKRGIDMFDCVIPTREGRHGRIFAWHGYKKGEKISKPEKIYIKYDITIAKHKNDFSPINSDSKIPELKNYTKAYLNYLFKINEPLGARLATLNNIEFYHQLMENLRFLVNKDKF